jgi:hypothetical protein
MTTQVIEVGGRPAIASRAVRRPRGAADQALPDVIRRLVAVVLLVFALYGMVAIATLAGAGAVPSQGPAPGFAL